MLLFVLLTGIPCVFLCVVYGRTTKSITPLEGEKRAPIFQHVSNTVSGLSTIRVFDKAGMMADEFNQIQVSN